MPMPRLSAVPVVVLAAGIVMPAQAPAETDYVTSLRAAVHYAGARGHSEYDREVSKREVGVTVTGICRLAGHRVVVFVGGRKVGTMRVSSRGRAHRDWSTEHGQSVPIVPAGSSVGVRTIGGGLIAAGRYHRDTDD